MRTPARDSEAGFTLIDSLVAVATLSAMTALLPQAIVTARQMSSETASLVSARLVADSVLADLARSSPHAGQQTGATDGHSWRVETKIREAGLTSGSEDGSSPALFTTRISIQVSGNRTLVVERLSYGEVE